MFLPESLKNSIKGRLGVPSVEGSLINLRRNQFHPRVVLDIGAYEGEWTRSCKAIWTEAQVLMIEAQPSRLPRLQHLANTLKGVTAEQALLGSSTRDSVPFYEQNSSSSVLPETEKQDQTFIQLPLRTLDEITDGTAFARPDLIKLDVQGYELEILRGGLKTLEAAKVVLTEVNLIEVYRGAPLLREVVNFFGDAGMRAYDICTFYRRPLDRALWQADILFVRNDSPLVSSKAYQ